MGEIYDLHTRLRALEERVRELEKEPIPDTHRAYLQEGDVFLDLDAVDLAVPYTTGELPAVRVTLCSGASATVRGEAATKLLEWLRKWSV